MATFVLIHGTTSGGWVWQQVARRLRAAGHEVYTPTLTGLGERRHLLSRDIGLDTHITDIVNVLTFEDLKDAVLVGHSYGGMVMLAAAELAPERLGHLVYFDSGVPRNGENSLDTMDPRGWQQTERLVMSQGDGWLIPAASLTNNLTRNTPHPWRCWTDRISLTNPAAAALPRTYVRFTADKHPGSFFELVLAEPWRRAQAAGWPIRLVDTVHQIAADPEPKAAVLLELFPGAATANSPIPPGGLS